MTGIIILAAGSSTRLEQPKQKVTYKGKTLLQHAVNAAAQVKNAKIIAVLGSNYEAIVQDLSYPFVKVVLNNDWQTGMASSVKAGLIELLHHDKVGEVLIMLCDQPFVDGLLLKQLIGLKPQTDDFIIACRYEETIGVPVVFSKGYFKELLALEGEQGAKKLLLNYADKLITYDFEGGKIDIDTPGDLEKLKQGEFS